jgi:hypothetical protein
VTKLSPIQQLFAAYAADEFLSGQPVLDDDGRELQAATWLYRSRYDDFIGEMSEALVEAGVSRESLMRIYLRHALRVLNENPDSIHAGSADNKNAVTIIDELVRHREIDEFLREKISKIDRGLPIPIGLHLK